MPRPKARTLADEVLAALADGLTPSEIAEQLKTSDTYVRVCRRRAREREAGLVRTRQGVVDATAVEGHYKRVGEKVRRTMLRKRRLALVGKRLAEARAERMAEREARRPSSIVNRRAHVNRILEAWRQA